MMLLKCHTYFHLFFFVSAFTMTSFLNTPPTRILVVTLRFLGDTLLVTPLLSSLKQAYPSAQIDVLLYARDVCIDWINDTPDNVV